MASVGRTPKGKNSPIPDTISNPKGEGPMEIPGTVSSAKDAGSSQIPNTVSGPKET